MTILNYINTNSNVLVCMECKLNAIQLIGFASFNILDVNQGNLVLDAMQLLLKQVIVEKKEKFDQISLMFQKNRSSQGALCALRILNNSLCASRILINYLNTTSKHIDINDQINANPEDDQSGPKTPITNADELYKYCNDIISDIKKNIIESWKKILLIVQDEMSLMQTILEDITLSDLSDTEIQELKNICQRQLDKIQDAKNTYKIQLDSLTDQLHDFQHIEEKDETVIIGEITILFSADKVTLLKQKCISFITPLIQPMKPMLSLFESTETIIKNKLQDINQQEVDAIKQQEKDRSNDNDSKSQEILLDQPTGEYGANSQLNNGFDQNSESTDKTSSNGNTLEETAQKISSLEHNQSQDTINAHELVIIYPEEIEEEQLSYSHKQKSTLCTDKKSVTIAHNPKSETPQSRDSGWASWIWLIAGGLGLGGFSYFKIFKKGEQTQENQDANKQKQQHQDIDQSEHQK